MSRSLKKLIILSAAIMLIAAACNKQSVSNNPNRTNNANQEALSKAQMVPLITDVQMLDLDLKNYYKIKNTFPTTLVAFADDKSYDSERSFMATKDLFGKYSYLVSSDRQHFVVYVNLTISKDKIGPVNNQSISSVNSTVLGIDCSNSQIFCLTD